MAKTLKELLDQYGHTRIGDADMALGRDNPGALEGILQERQNWANATTQAERDAAHNRAENIRKAYGQYSGGAEGMDGQYKPAYQKPAAAAENDNVMALYEKFNNLYGKTNAPTWTPQYQSEINGLLNDLKNVEEFEYNMMDDKLYQQYRDQYIREGQKAMRDSAAQTAAMTGGYGSTYGAIAAQQGYDNYLTQLNDVVPQLEQQAYGKYIDNIANMYNQLGAYQNEENRLYGQYLDDLGQYNADRDFAFNAMQAAIGQNNYENEFDRGVFESDRDYNMADKQLAIELALSTGDYSALKEMGVDTGMLDLEQTLAKAQAHAALGKLQGTTATGKGSSGNSGGGNSGGGNNKSGSYEITNQQNDEEVYIPGLRWVGNLSLKKMLETGEVVAEVNGNKITYKKAR